MTSAKMFVLLNMISSFMECISQPLVHTCVGMFVVHSDVSRVLRKFSPLRVPLSQAVKQCPKFYSHMHTDKHKVYQYFGLLRCVCVLLKLTDTARRRCSQVIDTW